MQGPEDGGEGAGARSPCQGTGPATRRRHGLDPGWFLPDGLRRALPRGGACPSGGGGWLLDRPHGGDQRPVPEVRQGHRPRDPGGAGRRSGPVSRRPAGPAAAGLDRVRAAARAGGQGRSLPLVAVRGRRRLAPSRGAGQFDQGARAPSGGAHRPCRCHGLRRLDWQAAAQRGGMGTGRSGRPGGRGLPLGE